MPSDPAWGHARPLFQARLLRWPLAAAAVAALLSLSVWAPQAQAQGGALPGEIQAVQPEQLMQVGQLSVVSGDLRLWDRDHQQWMGGPQAPLRNWPVSQGDKLRTGPDSRAQLRLGSTVLRLGSGVELTLTRLDDKAQVLHLHAGALAVHVAAPRVGEAPLPEVVTHEGRWQLQRPGHYRIERGQGGRFVATQASAWTGSIQFIGSESALAVPQGKRADIWLDASQPGVPAITRFAWEPMERDAFADWVAREEPQDAAAQTQRNLPVGVSAGPELEQHGQWRSVPELGEVWQPNQVPPGWAPYQNGRWEWVSPWGWTWIDAAPWGFAPFHFGSWLIFEGRWTWFPGGRHDRPVFHGAHPGWLEREHRDDRRPDHRAPPPRIVVPAVPVTPPRVWHPTAPRPAPEAPRPVRDGQRPGVDTPRPVPEAPRPIEHGRPGWGGRDDGRGQPGAPVAPGPGASRPAVPAPVVVPAPAPVSAPVPPSSIRVDRPDRARPNDPLRPVDGANRPAAPSAPVVAPPPAPVAPVAPAAKPERPKEPPAERAKPAEPKDNRDEAKGRDAQRNERERQPWR